MSCSLHTRCKRIDHVEFTRLVNMHDRRYLMMIIQPKKLLLYSSMRRASSLSCFSSPSGASLGASGKTAAGAWGNEVALYP